MSMVLGVLAAARVPKARSNQVISDGALALATAEGPFDKRAFHGEVVRWCREAPFAPCRFETPYTDAAASRLFAQKEPLLAHLAHLEGKAEFAIIAKARPEVLHESGRAFLQARAAKIAAHGHLSRALHERGSAITPYVRLTDKKGVLHAALLIPRDEIARVHDLGAYLAEEHRETHLVDVSGPWPAYSFGTGYVGDVS